MRKSIPGLAAVLASLALAVPATPGASEGTSTAASPLAERRFRFTYEATVKAVPEEAAEAYLWIPYPPDTPEQAVRGLTLETELPHRVVSEVRFGNRAVRLGLRPGAADQRITMRFEVTRRERRNRPDQDQDPPKVGLAGDPALWLGPDARVPIGEPVRTWAREAVGDRKDPLEIERAIYDYTVTHLKYDKSGTGWGRGDVYWACDNQRGNCTDFHAVFTGYSRAMGIPARFEIGFPIPPDRGQGEVAGYHCWAQFHIAGRGWIPVDASEASKNPEKRAYFFGAHDENRVLMSVGRDLRLPGMKGEPLNYFVYPYAEADGKPIAEIERRFSYEDLPGRAPSSDPPSPPAKER